MSTATAATNIRILADMYEQSQRLRIETGERIRAVLQERDETFTVRGALIPSENGDGPAWVDENGEIYERQTSTTRGGKVKTVTAADLVLSAIAAGETTGPVPILGRTYRRHWQSERETYNEMMSAVSAHPAWPWLEKVKGIGPTLACKLLARLDIERAPHRSSFWAYCGLGTVPGERYRCEHCGLTKGFPVGYNVKGPHKVLGGNAKCKGQLVKVAGPEDGVRVAQPRPSRGEKACYDQYAKKVMYQVATSFLKQGGPYEEFYRDERSKADRERPGWADGRRHYLALRKTEKLFLSHLWEVWRDALGMPVGEPYAAVELGHTNIIGPWDMVD